MSAFTLGKKTIGMFLLSQAKKSRSWIKKCALQSATLGMHSAHAVTFFQAAVLTARQQCDAKEIWSWIHPEYPRSVMITFFWRMKVELRSWYMLWYTVLGTIFSSCLIMWRQYKRLLFSLPSNWSGFRCSQMAYGVISLTSAGVERSERMSALTNYKRVPTVAR